MKLESEQGGVIDTPASVDIERVVHALDGEVNTFAILTKVPLTYIQTRVVDGQFELEYQNGDTDQHYQADRLVSRDEVVQAFSLYAKDDDAWQGLVEWQPLDLSSEPVVHEESLQSSGGCTGVVLLAVVLSVLTWAVV
ncbi:hypothetical protein NG895_02595 [Aeoliella sp. ICT_H6.2]|uniref:Uncharacterized protein n=1 Tax=Aeoliella straminimaris TaxID=2954799 RepID=A0A9X2FB48_9BACT|nr:hypothetical protein [Aeoliella straminimaris]MCO6042786.1 hypothetical protein [Aeoliella straminimaris]